MAGNHRKPRYSITARRKSDGKDSKAFIRIAAAWEGKFADRHQFSFEKDVAEIVMRDGTVLKPEDLWLDMKDWSQGGGTTRSANTPTGEPSGGGQWGGGIDDGGDIPFHHEPRRGRDLS